MSAKFINLIVTNGGDLGEGGFLANTTMDGDNLISCDYIAYVKPTIVVGNLPNYFEIFATSTSGVNPSTGQIQPKFILHVSKALTGSYDGASNKPSNEWMSKAKKVILEAISNQSPGGGRTTVVLPKDGADNVYFRRIAFA